MKEITFSRKQRRIRRVSANMHGTKERPRIVIFRSNKYIYAQAIDDASRVTVASASSLKLGSEKSKKSDQAKMVGVDLAKKLKEKKITKGIFDRRAYSYLGRVKSVAEGLREGGLTV